MLYTLITFVALFIVATTVAVIYYVKAEELRTTRDDLQEQVDTLANREEVRTLGGIVGNKLSGHSNLGTVVEHLNSMVRIVAGNPVPVTSAEVKVSSTAKRIEPLLERAKAFIPLPIPPAPDPNTIDPNNPADPNEVEPVQVALTDLIGDLLTKLDQTTKQRDTSEEQLGTLRKRFDDAITTMQQTEQTLTAKVTEYYQLVQDIKTDYNNLRLVVQQNSDERAQTLLDQLEKTRTESSQLNQDLLKAKAELNVAQGRLDKALAAVEDIKPSPDIESTAFKADGDIILVDEVSSVVHINLGSEDRIYRGLTFSVYDRAGGIPRDGKPKAQVEVLAVDRRVSTARILSSERKNPISVGDLAANLIWDANRQNQFVVAGQFDLDRDGKADYDAIRKIEALVQKWGGTVAQDVSADTDYVILGTEPSVPPEPTLTEQTEDPLAMQRYTSASQTNDRYQQIRRRSESLFVPIFNYDRFLSFTGYATEIDKPGAF
jgi:preprotein translocase subunit YajC